MVFVADDLEEEPWENRFELTARRQVTVRKTVIEEVEYIVVGPRV